MLTQLIPLIVAIAGIVFLFLGLPPLANSFAARLGKTERQRQVISGIIAGIGTLVILAAIAVPSFIAARNTSRKNACYGNLRQIDSSKEQWAMKNEKKDGTPCTLNDLLTPGDTNNSYIKNTPVCKSGGIYRVNAIGTEPSCSVHGTVN